MPVEKLHVVESVALNVPGYAATFFYFILSYLEFVL